ncbi:hypothetical protein UFOVP448_49 [uncultured Caudovirales phage]|uniref:Uncharacterized protein n=1 Tax=uncultured Caudovirales phage TaxID=2100421 RepID=A0A6J5M895_9CAUD|nr:hypothetical protein UFOVP448_49 [uncultured Caudovirales phage]
MEETISIKLTPDFINNKWDVEVTHDTGTNVYSWQSEVKPTLKEVLSFLTFFV